MDMSGNLDALVKRVLDRARDEATAIVERGKKAAERETQRAEEERAARKQASEAALHEAAERRIYSARAEAEQDKRRAMMNAREEAVEAVFAEALQTLQQIDAPAERRALLQKLVREGIRAVGAPAVRIRVNKTERDLARDPTFPGEIDGVSITLDEQALDASGGPVVTDDSGRVVYENTFEARLERMREPLRRLVARTLHLEEKKEEAR